MITYETLAPAPGSTSVALGFFDGLHLGHQAVLSAALKGKEEGLLPAVFTFSESPQRALSGRGAPELMTPAQKEEELRKMGFAALWRVDFSAVMKLEAETFVRDILNKTLCAGRVCCGFNYRFGRGGLAGCEEIALLCAPYHIEVLSLPPIKEEGEAISSTRIRALVEKGESEQAEKLLGRPFGFEFTVVHGRRIGRLMGTPTLNQPIPPNFVLPKFGVYASRVTFGGHSYTGVTNVGIKPTVGADAPLAETWMPDYTGEELYGCRVRVELLHYLRPEIRFESLEMLREAILADGRRAQRIVTLHG